jgi:hypothetical protein
LTGFFIPAFIKVKKSLSLVCPNMENEIHNIKIQNIFSMISIISIQSQNLILLDIFFLSRTPSTKTTT